MVQAEIINQNVTGKSTSDILGNTARVCKARGYIRISMHANSLIFIMSK